MIVNDWEPASGGLLGFDAWDWESDDEFLWESFDQVFVTLANGQRIIVRALSDERKAARAERKAELAPWMALGQDALDGLVEEVKTKGRCDGDPSFRPSRKVKKESAQ